MGNSVGGYLAAMLAVHDDLKTFLHNCPHSLPEEETHLGTVIFYSFLDFTNPGMLNIEEDMRIIESFWGETYESISKERLAEMSPIHWVDGSEKPFLLLHGTEDKLVPVEASIYFAEALEQASVDVETFYPKLGHAFDLGSMNNKTIIKTFRKVDKFINSLIMEP